MESKEGAGREGGRNTLVTMVALIPADLSLVE